MIYELIDLLDEQEERTIMLNSSFIVYGVELETVWRAECIGIVRTKSSSYNVILRNNAQFYRPLKRTSFVFQNNLLMQLRLTLIGRIDMKKLNKRKRLYIY